MAFQKDKIGLVKESLDEMLHVAEYAINYRKTNGGALGFPATITLFSIIDCLGSTFVNDNSFRIIIDGKERIIKRKSQHIYILNSKYFNLDLSQTDLENIYNNFRSTLTHNFLMPEGYYLEIGEKEKSPFKIAINEFKERIYFINLNSLFAAAKKAVIEFSNDLNNGNIIFEKTKIHQNIKNRDVKTPLYIDPKQPNQYQIKIKEWIKE